MRLDVQLRHGPHAVDRRDDHALTPQVASEVKSVKDKPAAAIEDAGAKKYQTYNPLLYVIKKQVLDVRRQREPHQQQSPLLESLVRDAPWCRSGWRVGSRGTWKVLESDLTEQASPLANSEQT